MVMCVALITANVHQLESSKIYIYVRDLCLVCRSMDIDNCPS